MAKKKAVQRKQIPYQGELRTWLGIRLNPQYRHFFDAYAERFLEAYERPVYDPLEKLGPGRRPEFTRDSSGKIKTQKDWRLKTSVSTSTDEHDANLRRLDLCRKKWGLLRPIDYSIIRPTGRILVNGPAQLAQTFLSITTPCVLFKIDISYSEDEIKEAFHAELTNLRHGIREQNKFGFKRTGAGKYSTIDLPGTKGRNKNIDTLALWSKAYELHIYSRPQKT